MKLIKDCFLGHFSSSPGLSQTQIILLSTSLFLTPTPTLVEVILVLYFCPFYPPSQTHQNAKGTYMSYDLLLEVKIGWNISKLVMFDFFYLFIFFSKMKNKVNRVKREFCIS